jgi:hypothetical protein
MFVEISLTSVRRQRGLSSFWHRRGITMKSTKVKGQANAQGGF